MIFRASIASFLAILSLASAAQKTVKMTIGDKTQQIQIDAGGDGTSKHYGQYKFHLDSSGSQCTDAQDNLGDEDFRLFCINREQAFRACALSCSKALHFEETVAECKDYRCDFYGRTFEDEAAVSVPMTDMQGKVTLVAMVPLWESFAQYNYEMMEHIRRKYLSDTAGVMIPIKVDTEDPVRIETFEKDNEKRISILKEILPSEILSHPFMSFVRTLSYKSGFQGFDVYTDRPVYFVISGDGKNVERLVTPTAEELYTAIEKHGNIDVMIDLE